MVIWSEIAKVVQDIRDKADILFTLPALGRTVPEMDDKNIREISLYSYRISYELKNDHVYMLTIVHKRRNLQS